MKIQPNLPRSISKQILLSLVMASAFSAAAEVRLPRIFTDNMVLQREMPVRVWGWADPGEAVKVSLAGANAATKADQSGQWSVEMPALKSGDNLELVVNGKNSLKLKNVAIGDLWVCSGQSNMEMDLGGCLGATEDIKAADLPRIRRIKINHEQAGQAAVEAPTATQWQVCSPDTVRGFTAVGFYFAREIQQKTGVTIGIVDDNWGGTPIEPWVPTEGLEIVPELKSDLTARQEAIKAFRAELPKALTGVEDWISKTRRDLANGTETTPMPAFPTHPGGNGWSGMYNAMIHPFVKLPIKGALWYQGESNGGEGETYYHKMQALIGGWRHQWNQGDFPFYFVQLASFQSPTENPGDANGWPKLREAQTKSLTIPNTGMAVITDTVPLAEAGDIHPKNKYDVGLRLACWALNRDYGLKDVEVSGPLFKALKIEGNRARVMFDHVGSGLMMGTKVGRTPASENKEGKLKRFAVAGADKKWHWAEAVIENNTILVSAPEVSEPVAVRFAFQMNPDGANLYNREGLPASPFRTDNW